MPTIQDFFNSKDFYGLSVGDQLTALRGADQDFAGLSPKDQGTVLAGAVQKFRGNDKIQGPPEDRGFFSTLGGDIAGMAKTAGRFMQEGPMASALPGGVLNEAGNAMVQHQAEYLRDSRDAFKRGEYGRGIVRGAEGLAPVIGPAAGDIGQELDAGQLGQGMAHFAEFALPNLGHAVIPARVGPFVRDVTNPTERAALDYAKSKGVPVSLGQDTGQHGIQRAEQMTRNLPGSAYRAEKFYRGQEDALATTGRDLASKPSGIQTNEVGAGEAVQKRLNSRISTLKSQADKLYDSVRQDTAAATKQVQTGTKASSVLDASGNPIQTPVFSTLEAPVDLGPVRQQLQPVYEELKRSLPDARRANSPAWRNLEELMTSDKSQMNAMDFDKSLSAVKSLARDTSPQSQRIANMVVDAGEKEFQKALNAAGPNTAAKLQSARRAVRAYHETGELLEDLRSEPAQLYRNLVSGGDTTINTLRDLDKVAPRELKTVGRTFLDGLVDKATKEGGFGRSPGIAADWNRMGPETKNLLFGSQLSGDLDKFMLAAKRLTSNVNPSGSAHSIIAATGTLGAAGEILRSVLTGNLQEAAGIAGGAFVVPNAAARVFFTPGGAKLMTQAISVPVGSPAFTNAVKGLNAMALAGQTVGQRALPPPPKSN